MIPYTLVCGVDKKHLDQLRYTWPTWKKHKSGLLDNPMIVFIDPEQVWAKEVKQVIDHPDLQIVNWSPIQENSLMGPYYGEDNGEKWTNPQRVKMITGFVYMSAMHVKTKYWLKLDTDVVATGQPDWIDENWFKNDPAIICHPWGFTRPPHQMLDLDAWVSVNADKDEFNPIAACEPLNLHPEPGADRVGHKRIISWCGFFKAGLSRACVSLSEASGRPYTLPVPSQDGIMWYITKRLGLGIERVSMKKRGWQQWSTMGNIRKYSEEAL